MLDISSFGPFTRIRLTRTFLGRPVHDVSAYLLDDLLIDSGPPTTARELVAWCRQRPVSRVVTGKASPRNRSTDPASSGARHTGTLPRACTAGRTSEGSRRVG